MKTYSTDVKRVTAIINVTLAKIIAPIVTGMFMGIFLLSPALFGIDSVSSYTLVLKDKSVVNSDIVRIKDVAVMDSPTRERIGELAIAASPEIGKSISIEKQEIFEKLVGNGFKSPEIKGSSMITVTRKGTMVKASFFKDQIYDYVIENSKWKDGIDVEIVSTKDIVIPESDVRWKITPANGQDFFGSILFDVKAISTLTNEVLFSNWITAKLKITKEVAVSNADITRGQLISENDVRWETREITAFTKDAILTREEVIGQRAGRMIRPNSVITTSLMEKKFMVRRGEMAVLLVKLNGVNASTSVKVLADGAMGDTVQVMNMESKKIITGTVSGRNTVEVNVK